MSAGQLQRSRVFDDRLTKPAGGHIHPIYGHRRDRDPFRDERIERRPDRNSCSGLKAYYGIIYFKRLKNDFSSSVKIRNTRTSLL